MSTVLRRGRIAATRRDVVRFISSVENDRRIARSAVLVNEAHVIALSKAGVLTPANARKLIVALRKIEKHPLFREGAEDVHVLIEEYVTRQTGAEVGGMLNTGKSRNDQVTTAIRMTLREALLELSSQLIALERELLRLAAKHVKSFFVGYTHLQPAQPVTFAHYLLAIGDSVLRNNQRVSEAYARTNNSPMGGAALAGTSFRIDRRFVARLLGFDGLVDNSLDAVGSRDFVLDALTVSSIIATDLSRIAQDLIFYSSEDVGLVELPDDFASTSSIMPQKKNPDLLEVVRARCAKIIGNFSSAATTLHALPTGYNLDFQELTPLLWDSLDTVSSCLDMLIQLIPNLRLAGSILERDKVQLITATEIANVLVRETGLSFRGAHRVVGRAIRLVLEKEQTLKDLTKEFWEDALRMQLSEKTFRRILDALNVENQTEFYRTRGSPSSRETRRMIPLRRRQIAAAINWNLKARVSLQTSLHTLQMAIP